MERFVRRENLAHLRRLLAQTSDDAQRQLIIKLIAEEGSKGRHPANEN